MLLNLPDELLVYGIIEVIDDFQDLQSLSLTCRQLYGLTTPYIYRSIRLLTAQGATSLAETVENSVSRTADSSLFVQPTLAEKIQVLDLRPRFNRDVGFERLTSKLKWMTNLRELTLESSRCNYGHYWESADPIDWPKLMYGYPLIFMEAAWGLADQKPLQNLTSLTLHLSGTSTRFWDMAEISSILILPSLERLTVSCAGIIKTLPDLTTYYGKTALTDLTFIECEVPIDALGIILSLPKALTSLHLGQMRHHNRNDLVDNGPFPREHPALAEKDIIRILQHQRNSLESLTIVSKRVTDEKYIRRMNVADSDLSGLTQLKSLTLQGSFPYLLSTLLSEHAPPNLRQLRLHKSNTTVLRQSQNRVSPDRIDSFPAASSLRECLPRLSSLDVAIGPLDKQQIRHLWQRPETRKHIIKLDTDYQHYGIELSIHVVWRTNYIPPILHGEHGFEIAPAYLSKEKVFPKEMSEEPGEHSPARWPYLDDSEEDI